MITRYFDQKYINDKCTTNLIEDLEKKYNQNLGYIYYAFPTIKELDSDPITPNILLILQGYGVFSIICDDVSNNRKDIIDKIENEKRIVDANIFSKLVKNKKLAKNSRTLNINFFTISYYPNLNNADENELIFNRASQLFKWLEQIKKENEGTLDEEFIKEIFASIDASSAIIRPKTRKVSTDNFTKANVLAYMESQIANFDDVQRLAALSVLDGPQRIRGLAGTGKTIILCLKAAKLHYEKPDKKILYTFYTKSLYDYIRQLITRFYMKLTEGNLPDFDKSILIRHAWGGSNIPGVYSDACISNGVKPIKYSELKHTEIKDAFDYVCNDLLDKTNAALNKDYDYVLIDEAQDFDSSFYQICRQIVKNDHIIWCYDELQNIFDVKIQSSLETFRNEKYGLKGISLKSLAKRVPDISNDIVLPRSYRNLKEILVTAHAVGFGIYNERLIQSLENNDHWSDLGYVVKNGDCQKYNEKMIIERNDDNSPLKMPLEYKENDIIVTYSAESFEEECQWVCDCIENSINEEGLRPDDILIISLDEINSHNYSNRINEILFEKNIDLNSVVQKYYSKGFVRENSVTFSSVYKAKGNEAAMVFVVGCDAFEKEKDSRSMRNKIFTSFTRAKVWLRISGLGIEDSSLIKEIKQLQKNNYQLRFVNTPMTRLKRDWDENSKRVELKNEALADVKEILKNKKLTKEELIELLNQEV